MIDLHPWRSNFTSTGIQALFWFQLILEFNENFGELPQGLAIAIVSDLCRAGYSPTANHRQANQFSINWQFIRLTVALASISPALAHVST